MLSDVLIYLNFSQGKSPSRRPVLLVERLTTKNANGNVKISQRNAPEHMVEPTKVARKDVRISGGNPATVQKAVRNHPKRKSKTKSRPRLRVLAVRANPVNSPSALNSAARSATISPILRKRQPWNRR